MKNKLLITVSALVVLFIGCRKDNFRKLSTADQEAFEEMELTFYKAQLYNDSLIYCDDPEASCSQEFIEHCDNRFHYYANQWGNHHDNYSHDNGHCDHYHDNGMMNHHGRNRDNHDNDEEHHEYHHNMMDDLEHDHDPYHPQ